jgi:hypothetical protein
MIPITVQEWNEPKKARLGATFVNKRSKKDLWRNLMANFILPPEYSKMDDDGHEIPGGCERRRKVKQYALKKMGEAFRSFKKMLNAKYIAKQKTPVFEGAYEKLRQQWPKFVAFKASERAKEMSEKNKANVDKKAHHHIFGLGGYKSAVPQCEAMENELRNHSRYRGLARKGQALVVRTWRIVRPGNRGVCSSEADLYSHSKTC